MKKYLLFMASLAFLTLLVELAAIGQEAPARQTRVWRAYELPRSVAGNRGDVDILDTEGVCLYVVRGEAGAYGETPVAIAAVPKTQLPKSAGCQ